jgi:hypothetical protein
VWYPLVSSPPDQTRLGPAPLLLLLHRRRCQLVRGVYVHHSLLLLLLSLGGAVGGCLEHPKGWGTCPAALALPHHPLQLLVLYAAGGVGTPPLGCLKQQA